MQDWRHTSNHQQKWWSHSLPPSQSHLQAQLRASPAAPLRAAVFQHVAVLWPHASFAIPNTLAGWSVPRAASQPLPPVSDPAHGHGTPLNCNGSEGTQCSLGARCDTAVNSSAETPVGTPQTWRSSRNYKRPFAADKWEHCQPYKQPEFHCSLISLEVSLWTCSSHVCSMCTPCCHAWWNATAVVLEISSETPALAQQGLPSPGLWYGTVECNSSERIRAAQCVTAIYSHRTRAMRHPDQSKCLTPLWSQVNLEEGSFQ